MLKKSHNKISKFFKSLNINNGRLKFAEPSDGQFYIFKQRRIRIAVAICQKSLIFNKILRCCDCHANANAA